MKVWINCLFKKKKQNQINHLMQSFLCNFFNKRAGFHSFKKYWCFVTANRVCKFSSTFLEPWCHQHRKGLQIINETDGQVYLRELVCVRHRKLLLLLLLLLLSIINNNPFSASGGDCPIAIDASDCHTWVHANLRVAQSFVLPSPWEFFSVNVSVGFLLQARGKGTDICGCLSVKQANH